MDETDLSLIVANNTDLQRLNPGLAPKRNKYGNVKGEYKGRVYDSKRERDYAQRLDLEGLVWVPQVTFPLAGGIKIRVDFVVLNPDSTWEVRDAKGYRTKEYRLKRKLFKEKYSQEIMEV